MPTLEKDFNPSSLWPKSSHNRMHPTAAKSLAHYPAGLDYGALRVQSGIWEIFTPAGGSPGYLWIAFDPANPTHLYAANAFNRVGRGWSFGPAHGMHDEVRGYFQDVYGRNPTDMEKLDIEHDDGLWKALLKKWEAIKPVEVDPDPIEVDPVDPIDPIKPPSPPSPPISPSPSLALSSPEERTQELLSLIPFRDMILPKFVIESLPRAILELVRSKRRTEDRIAQRVIDAVIAVLKKG